MSGSGALLLRQQPLHKACRASSSKGICVVAHFAGPQRSQVALCSLSASRGTGTGCPQLQSRRRAARGRQLVVRSIAMVNVDFASPSLLLGTALIGCGVLLLNLRNFQNKVSRDADIVVAAMVSIVGSTLIFQGWRLDPLLLLCQALTTSVAFWYGLETFRLRSKEADMSPPQLPPGVGPDPASMDAQQYQQYQQYQQQQQGGYPPGAAPFLPPGGETGYYPWGEQGAASASGRPEDMQPPYGAGMYGSPYGETIQYDYYGNPILSQQQQQQPEAAYDGASTSQYGGTGPGYSGDPGFYGAAASQADPYGSYSAGPGPSSAPPASWPAGVAAGQGYGPPAGAGAPGPYAAQGGAPQPLPDQFSLPPVTSASVGTGAGVAAAGDVGAYGSAYGTGGGATAAGGRRQVGRLDLHEKVDDWE